MELFIIGVVSFLSGIMASMGLGGGMVLILYLTIFASKSQLEAQGINLIFFIPIAVLALILHTKKGLVRWKSVILPVVFGVISVSLCAYFAQRVNADYLRKAFAVFIILTGIVSLFKKSE